MLEVGLGAELGLVLLEQRLEVVGPVVAGPVEEAAEAGLEQGQVRGAQVERAAWSVW